MKWNAASADARVGGVAVVQAVGGGPEGLLEGGGAGDAGQLVGVDGGRLESLQ